MENEWMRCWMGNLRKQQNWDGATGQDQFSAFLFRSMFKSTKVTQEALNGDWPCISGKPTIILCKDSKRRLVAICDIQDEAGYLFILVLYSWAQSKQRIPCCVTRKLHIGTALIVSIKGWGNKSKHSWWTQSKWQPKWPAFWEVLLNFKKTVIRQSKTLLYKGTKQERGGGYSLGIGQQSQISKYLSEIPFKKFPRILRSGIAMVSTVQVLICTVLRQCYKKARTKITSMRNGCLPRAWVRCFFYLLESRGLWLRVMKNIQNARYSQILS